jgi:hypothetical protein
MYLQRLMERLDNSREAELRAEIKRLKAERNAIIEQCAQICDEEAGEEPHLRWEWTDGFYAGARACAKAIRALKEN